MSRVYIGACSWSDFTSLYPPGLPANQQITWYSRRFPLVEVDATFYRLMPRRTFALWAERTPPGFVFDVKAYRQLTWHDRETPPDDDTAAAFYDSVQPLREANKLGALHYQFPPWFTHTPANLAYLLALPERSPGAQLSVEFRHRSWYAPEVYPALVGALRGAGFTLTVVDAPQVGSGTVPNVSEVTSTRLAVLRLHGRNTAAWYKKVKKAAERFDYRYDTTELQGFSDQVRTLAELAETVHVLFNNNYNDYAVENGRELRALLRAGLPGHEVVSSPEE